MMSPWIMHICLLLAYGLHELLYSNEFSRLGAKESGAARHSLASPCICSRARPNEACGGWIAERRPGRKCHADMAQ
jgi:hypothetical protein